MFALPHIAEVAILILVAYLVGCLAGLLLRLVFSQAAADAEAPARRASSSPMLTGTPSEQFAAIAGLKPTPTQRLAANIGTGMEAPPVPVARPVFTAVVTTGRPGTLLLTNPLDPSEPVTVSAPAPVLRTPELAFGSEPAKIADLLLAKSTPRAGFGKPGALASPRGGVKDNLRLIKGIGPRIEKGLNDLGVFHFDQIATWDRKTVVWVETHFSFKGRIEREKWVSQAWELSNGPVRTPRPLRA
jgi:predicted flap endonuclease-1-like 5' DNA nuclease